jgi:hypothetical protein
MMAVMLVTATTPLLASTVNLGALAPFTGGDAGEGLDLTGNMVYAFNLGGPALTVQGVNFVAADRAAPPAGITTTAGNNFNYFAANGNNNAADYGATADDDALESLVTTIWYDFNWTFDLAVTPGNQYQLQLILQEGYFAGQGNAQRNFDVSVETASPSTLTLAVDDLALGLETDGAAPAQPGADFGLVYTYTFTAADSSFRVALDESAAGSLAILAAVTLEQVGVLTNPVVTLDGGTTADSIATNAPVGTRVGQLSMVGTNAAGFTYALNAGGETNVFTIPAGSSNLVTKAALGAGPYVLKIEGSKGGFSVTNDFTITVTPPSTVSLSGATVFHTAPVGTPVGTLSMANAASQAGFTYALLPSGDTTHFAISNTNKLLTAASLTPGTYDIVVLATNAVDGFWVTNGFTITAVPDFDDFSTDPGILNGWTEYGYFNADGGTPTWDSGDKDLDLSKPGGGIGNSLGLYRTGATRLPTDPVTLTVKALSRAGGTWGFMGLMISAVAQPGYISTADDTYTLQMGTINATDFQFLVTRTYLDGIPDYVLYTGPSQTFIGPYVLEIVRDGAEYVFKANGTTLYTTGTAGGDVYDTAAKDALIYYEIVMASDGNLTATVDDFGIIPVDVAIVLDGSRSNGSIPANAPVGTRVGQLSVINTNLAGLTYALTAGSGTNVFHIPSGTSNLVSTAALGAGPYALTIAANSGGFSLTNDFTIQVGPPLTVSLSNTELFSDAAVGSPVGILSMANAASQSGFTYALIDGTNTFDISNTNTLVTAASIDVGTYDIVVLSTNANDGFWITNGFTITVLEPVDVSIPVQYWRLDDGSGTNAINHIPAGNTATLVGPPTWITAGLPPKLRKPDYPPSTAALDFRSGVTNDYLDGGNINLTSTGAGGEVTVSMWLKPDTLTGDDRLFGPLSGATSQAGAVGEGESTGVGGLWVWTGATFGHLANAGSLSVGTWQHLVLVWDSGQVTAYLDGVEHLTATANFEFGAANGNFGIGSRFVGTFGDGFDGQMDEIAIFNVALNAHQISQLANGVVPGAARRPTTGFMFTIR